MKAENRNIRISPKKANLIASMVRGMKVEEALHLLKFMPKKGAKLIYKIIASAKANAENNQKIDGDKLIIKEIIVNKGPTMKRGLAVSRGRWHPIRKRSCHVKVELSL